MFDTTDPCSLLEKILLDKEVSLLLQTRSDMSNLFFKKEEVMKKLFGFKILFILDFLVSFFKEKQFQDHSLLIMPQNKLQS